MNISLAKRVAAGFAATALGVTITACGGGGGGDTAGGDFDGEVKVGILHSLSGTMAISETTLKEVEEMAIKEINDAGGVEVDGKSYKIVATSEDGASDWPTFAEKSQKLIDADGVAVVFGGWTSASRKAMLPVYEAKNHMLFYPIQYEGQECSRNIFYTGAVPNQQAEPAVDWLFETYGDTYGKKVYLVGSDYVYPRTANTIIKEQVKSLGGETVGEDYIPLGNTEVAPIIAKIKEEFPDGGIIINTLNGDSNVALFKQFKAAGIDPDKYPIMSFSIAEEEIRQIGPEYVTGTYAAWNYFMSLGTEAANNFNEAFLSMYGEDRVTNDPMESAYNMVYLWKAAVEKAGTFEDLDAVRTAMIGIQLDAPQGPIEMYPNHHISQTVRIGKVQENGQFEILWDSGEPVPPITWNQFVPETKGYTCDWTQDRPDAGKFKM
ncbi:urea ABC transporter substrate-binding protein [Synechococcus sp. RSCCF101]|uniref:urea ABC transporter substrate-binding protein n=1 Tax=Synechococcus sp. RSCCF101 TaxID=2511069 RepID=UPI001247BA4A|nr:urea ABC transporter substrate-binding protein [Synechococcus sp. RSCCF101]QEY32639.1 urea ABC transporter substrate-binding protein [Synechococcus sp. RSCCF101]